MGTVSVERRARLEVTYPRGGRPGHDTTSHAQASEALALAVALLQAARMISVQRILVPLDHSPGLDTILGYACAVARGMNASLTLLHVYEPPNEMVGVVPGATVSGELAADRRAGAALLDQAIETLRGNGVAPVDTILERSSPARQAILDHAQRGGFDLIVMGTHGRKGMARLVMGSVAESVLRDATCPVLTIHLPHE